MKTLLGLLSLLFGSGALIAGVAALVILYGTGVTASWEAAGTPPPFAGSLLIAAVGMATIVGLLLAVASSFGGLIMTVIHILCKRWAFALLSLAVCASSVGLWIFFVSKPFK